MLGLKLIHVSEGAPGHRTVIRLQTIRRYPFLRGPGTADGLATLGTGTSAGTDKSRKYTYVT